MELTSVLRDGKSGIGTPVADGHQRLHHRVRRLALLHLLPVVAHGHPRRNQEQTPVSQVVRSLSACGQPVKINIVNDGSQLLHESHLDIPEDAAELCDHIIHRDRTVVVELHSGENKGVRR